MIPSLNTFRGRTALRTVCSVVIFSMLLASCSRWQPVTGSAAAGLDARQDQLAKITLTDGRDLYLWSPRVANDSLLGFERRNVPRHLRTSSDRAVGYREYPVGVPLSTVQSLAFPEPDGARTALLLGGLAVGFAIFVAIAVSSLDMGISGPDSGPFMATPRR